MFYHRVGWIDDGVVNEIMKSALIWLGVCLGLAGCGRGQEDVAPPLFVGGTNYAVVSTKAMEGGVARAGTLSLYYFPEGPKGSQTLVWPYLTVEDEAVIDRLVVFNGGLSEDSVWKFYPALLAYAGKGSVVEISRPACRQIKGWLPAWTNFSFSVLGISNGMVRLDASQRLPLETDRPKRLVVELSQTEILQAVLAAQTNAAPKSFGGVSYEVAE